MNDNALFDADEFDAPIRLRDRYQGVPPFSTLNRREGWWQSRKQAYADIGLRSGDGREAQAYTRERGDDIGDAMNNIGDASGVSIFDPVLAEIITRWYMAPNRLMVDPFAGGSVRGVVAGIWGRRYYGIDLSATQVDANREQIGGELAQQFVHPPTWVVDDARDHLTHLPAGYATGGVFTCPPYYDLERYSDDPADISGWDEAAFDAYMAETITEQYRVQASDTFAVWVVSEVRNPQGNYRGLVPNTIGWHRTAGYAYYQEAILLDPIGTAQLRAPRIFDAAHKLVPVHQNALVFLKGDARAAARKVGNNG